MESPSIAGGGVWSGFSPVLEMPRFPLWKILRTWQPSPSPNPNSDFATAASYLMGVGKYLILMTFMFLRLVIPNLFYVVL